MHWCGPSFLLHAEKSDILYVVCGTCNLLTCLIVIFLGTALEGYYFSWCNLNSRWRKSMRKLKMLRVPLLILLLSIQMMMNHQLLDKMMGCILRQVFWWSLSIMITVIFLLSYRFKAILRVAIFRFFFVSNAWILFALIYIFFIFPLIV